jgi:hypothetical protein
MNQRLFLSGLVTAVVVSLAVGGVFHRDTTSADRVNPRAVSVAGIRRVFTDPKTNLTLPDSMNAARTNLAHVTALLYERSGYWLDAETTACVGQAEGRYATTGKGFIEATDLTETLTGIVIDRFSRLTDTEIKELLTTMQGFRSEKTPRGTLPPDEILIRPWGPVVKIDRAQEYLRQARSPRERAVLTDLVRLMIGNEVTNRIRLFEAAQPEYWSARRITPTQAVVLTYSVLSGDQFIRTADELARDMRAKQRYYEEKQKIRFSLENQFAFGRNGVLYGSPVDLLDGRAIRQLLRQFE